MAEQFIGLVVLAEDLSSVPRTYIRKMLSNGNSGSRGSDPFFEFSQVLFTHVIHIDRNIYGI